MIAKVVVDLPLSGAGCGAIQVSTDGVDLEVSVYSGIRKIGKLSFDTVTAFRFRDEMHSLGFVEGSYDAVVEIAESEWLSQTLAIEPDAIHLTAKTSKHFAVMFSSNGYLEVIARSVGFEVVEA
jgi:hypothetical protein